MARHVFAARRGGHFIVAAFRVELARSYRAAAYFEIAHHVFDEEIAVAFSFILAAGDAARHQSTLGGVADGDI